MLHPKNDNFHYLFYSLLVFLIGLPIAEDLELLPDRAAQILGTVMVLAIGVWTFQRNRRVFAVGMFLAVTGILITIANSLVDSEPLARLPQIIFLLFIGMAIVESLRQVALSTEISANRLVGAVCVYLMLGLIWALMYSLLYSLNPEAWTVPETGSGAPSLAYWLYYSFVTLTTLGYGDILPISATARTLAYAEALFGQLYVAILVAGLVSAYISDRQSN